MMYKKKPDGVFYNHTAGRLMQHQGYANRIYWNKNMIDILRMYYPTTKNEEVAGMLGVSQRTMLRKAREIGLLKTRGFLSKVWNENRQLAHATNAINGNSGMFKKGHTPWNKKFNHYENRID